MTSNVRAVSRPQFYDVVADENTVTLKRFFKERADSRVGQCLNGSLSTSSPQKALLDGQFVDEFGDKALLSDEPASDDGAAYTSAIGGLP